MLALGGSLGVGELLSETILFTRFVHLQFLRTQETDLFTFKEMFSHLHNDLFTKEINPPLIFICFHNESQDSQLSYVYHPLTDFEMVSQLFEENSYPTEFAIDDMALLSW